MAVGRPMYRQTNDKIFENEGNDLYRPMAYCVDCPDIWHVNS